MPNSTSAQNFRLLLPEIVWLEPEHFLLATQISSVDNTNDAWQVYLNTLALLALEVWLSDRLLDQVISRDTSVIQASGSLRVGEFKFCAIATEHLLDEVVNIPQGLIDNPELAAHFYVLLEVLEEEEEVVIRGFLPYNQLIETKSNLAPIRKGCYQLPLSLFDLEPNHLLLYQHYLQASAFLPVAELSPVNKISTLFHSNTNKLSQWLQGVIDESWQTIDSLSSPALSSAFSTRNIDQGTKRAKIIDLGIDLGTQKVALLVNISADSQDKVSVLAQLYPMNGQRFLPPNIQLVLLSKAGKTLQEVTSRIQDNYIQLKVFKGETGKKFSLQVSLGDLSVKENFEL